MNDPAQKRPETVALSGTFLHLAAAGLLAGLAAASGEKGLFALLAVATGIGFFVFLACFIHLRLRRLATAEKLDREAVERTRAAQGLVPLFAEDDVPPAARNLRQMDRYLAPLFALGIAVLLLAPLGLALWLSGGNPFRWAFADMPLSVASAYGILPLLAAFVLFILGTYAAGLCRTPQWQCLRAGAGYALACAALLALAGALLLLGGKIGFYPARAVQLLLIVWTTLQAAEILLNVVLDHYRPRLAGVAPRPAYDSRVSGLLAEPEGVFKSFANALDYQFGFKVSDTWFFRFIEKSLAPLALIMLVVLYLLSCFVVVGPGQAAVVERLGVPRGLPGAVAPGGAVDWDAVARVAPPLKNGVHLKWPWPFETARVVDQARPTVVSFGVPPETAAANAAKLDDPNFVASWDMEHQADEYLYMMPLRDHHAAPGGAGNVPDVVLISGRFLVEYRIDSDADVYRYLYNHRDSAAMLRTLTERELAVGLAGDDFWQVLTHQSASGVRERLRARLAAAVGRAGLGLTVTGVAVANLHPPAGETGKAFLDVTASLQKRETEINNGKIAALRITGMAPAQAQEITDAAQAYTARRLKLAEADAHWFRDQLRADAASPEIFRMEKQMRTLENALGKAQKVILPPGATMIMDDTKAADPNAINNILARELNKLNNK